MKSNSRAEHGFMTRGIARGGNWQHIDESAVNSKLKAWDENSCRDTAWHDAIGKLSLENSWIRSAPRVRGAEYRFLQANRENRLLLQVDCSLSHPIECGDGFSVGFGSALGKD
jgi:hypothetical protein